MRPVVFVGPSLAGAGAPRPAGIDFRGPAGCGTILAAARAGAPVIGLIDGVFESARSVWHKEILWALDHGAVVAGAASMGALRAAELDRHGMVGRGRIYALYRSGALEDDDEVAVLHGPAGAGWAPVTEAMVSLRETLGDAARARVLTAAEREDLEAFAKALFYKDRSWDAVLGRCRARGWPPDRVRAFAAWLGANRRDVKREDACDLVAWIAAGAGAASGAPAAAGPRPASFAPTRFWDALAARPAPRNRADGS